MLPYVAGAPHRNAGVANGSWGSPLAPGEAGACGDRDTAPTDSHLRTLGASSTEKTMNRALQPRAKKRHRKGTAWPAGVPSGFGWGPWRVRTIWLGRLGHLEGRQAGVRLWGPAGSTASLQPPWLAARSRLPASGQGRPPTRPARPALPPHQVLPALLPPQSSHSSVSPASTPRCGGQFSLAGLGSPGGQGLRCL